VPMASRIWQPFKKPSCSSDSVRESMGLILVAMIFGNKLVAEITKGDRSIISEGGQEISFQN
jgi:hypothetical protein